MVPERTAALADTALMGPSTRAAFDLSFDVPLVS